MLCVTFFLFENLKMHSIFYHVQFYLKRLVSKIAPNGLGLYEICR